jgi:hypothetical protein
MGTTVSSQVVQMTNEMILNAMVENQMGCDAGSDSTQISKNCGFSLFEFQKQVNKIDQSCSATNKSTMAIQQSVIENLSKQLTSDSKFMMPSTTADSTVDIITNSVRVNLTQENITNINSRIFSLQDWTNCGVSIVAIQEQYNKIALKAVSDVMSTTSLYQDLNNALNVSDQSSATFIGIGGMFLIMIVCIVALYYMADVATDPNTGTNMTKVAAVV